MPKLKPLISSKGEIKIDDAYRIKIDGITVAMFSEGKLLLLPLTQAEANVVSLYVNVEHTYGGRHIEVCR